MPRLEFGVPIRDGITCESLLNFRRFRLKCRRQYAGKIRTMLLHEIAVDHTRQERRQYQTYVCCSTPRAAFSPEAVSMSTPCLGPLSLVAGGEKVELKLERQLKLQHPVDVGVDDSHTGGARQCAIG